MSYRPKIWEISIVFIGFLGLVWFLMSRYLAPSLLRLPNLVKITKKDILEKVQTGDLLFFSGTTQGERVIRFFHNSYYSHVCMAIRVDGEIPEKSIFIWETDLGQGYKDGPRIMRLSEKLDRWKGIKIAMWKRYIPCDALGKSRPTSLAILEIAQDYLAKGVQMDITMVSWFFSRWRYDTKLRDFVFCSELIADTLQKLGVLSKEKHPSWYSPENFARGNIPIIKGEYSTNPIYFDF